MSFIVLAPEITVHPQLGCGIFPWPRRALRPSHSTFFLLGLIALRPVPQHVIQALNFLPRLKHLSGSFFAILFMLLFHIHEMSASLFMAHPVIKTLLEFLLCFHGCNDLFFKIFRHRQQVLFFWLGWPQFFGTLACLHLFRNPLPTTLSFLLPFLFVDVEFFFNTPFLRNVIRTALSQSNGNWRTIQSHRGCPSSPTAPRSLVPIRTTTSEWCPTPQTTRVRCPPRRFHAEVCGDSWTSASLTTRELLQPHFVLDLGCPRFSVLQDGFRVSGFKVSWFQSFKVHSFKVSRIAAFWGLERKTIFAISCLNGPELRTKKKAQRPKSIKKKFNDNFEREAGAFGREERAFFVCVLGEVGGFVPG